MKQFFTVLLACALIVSLTGCYTATLDDPAVPAAGKPEPAAASPQEAAPTQPPAATDSKLITEEEARDIALAHVGLTSDQVQRLRVHYEWDDGVAQYDVEFHDGKTEYEFEIHAETGKILSYDRDRLGD